MAGTSVAGWEVIIHGDCLYPMYLSSVLSMDDAKPAIIGIESLKYSSTLP